MRTPHGDRILAERRQRERAHEFGTDPDMDDGIEVRSEQIWRTHPTAVGELLEETQYMDHLELPR